MIFTAWMKAAAHVRFAINRLNKVVLDFYVECRGSVKTKWLLIECLDPLSDESWWIEH